VFVALGVLVGEGGSFEPLLVVAGR